VISGDDGLQDGVILRWVKAMVWSASSIALWSDGEKRPESMRHRQDPDDDELDDLPCK
jgi:hypothetical protein